MCLWRRTWLNLFCVNSQCAAWKVLVSGRADINHKVRLGAALTDLSPALAPAMPPRGQPGPRAVGRCRSGREWGAAPVAEEVWESGRRGDPCAMLGGGPARARRAPLQRSDTAPEELELERRLEAEWRRRSFIRANSADRPSSAAPPRTAYTLPAAFPGKCRGFSARSLLSLI